MNKKIFIVPGIITVIAIAGYFGSGKMFQGRLSYVNQTVRPSIAMKDMCIEQEALNEKYKKFYESKASEPANSDSESDSDSSESDKRNISVTIPTTSNTGSGRGMIENINDDENTTEDYNDEDESENEDTLNDYEQDGSETHPYRTYVECDCKKGGTIVDKKIDENGFYNIKVCNLPDLFQCAPPQFKCPEGSVVDTLSLDSICKNQKVKQCFSANPFVNQETSDMCSKLYYGYDKLKCVNQSQCEKYIKMSSTELFKYINSLIGNNPPEGMFEGGGVFGVNKKYKPKNDQEKKMFQEAKLIVDCEKLYDVKLF